MIRGLRPLLAVFFAVLLSGCLHDEAGTYSISGQIRDTNNAAVSGVSVQLSGASVSVAVSDANGVYSFGGLADGDYTVRPIKQGYTFDPRNKSVRVSGTNASGIDFEARPNSSANNTFLISGRVMLGNSSNGVGGVSIALSGAATLTTTTAADGSYQFPNLAAGQYTVTPALTGYTFDPSSAQVTLTNGPAQNINFSATQVSTTPTYTITGVVRLGTTTGLANITVNLTGPNALNISTTTNNDGQFAFANLGNGNYTVTPNSTQYTFSPTFRNAPITNANVMLDPFSATAVQAPTYRLSGRVTTSSQGQTVGLAGVEMRLAGKTTSVASTIANGNYEFTGLEPGTYTITPSHTGHTFDPNSREATITSGNIGNLDFSAISTSAATYEITGTITLQNGTPVSGVTVEMSNGATGSQLTDSNGRYTFSGLANATYRLTPKLTGYTFSPTFVDVTINNANATVTAFQATPPATYSIAGRIVTAGTTTGIANVSVQLAGGSVNTTATTNNNGDYQFTNVANGTYVVTPTLANYTFTQPSRTVTVNGANVNNIDFTGTNQSNTTYSVSGRITLENTTTGVGGVLVSTGQGSPGATTSANGNYTISGLAPGQYTLTPTLANYTFTPTAVTVTITNANIQGQNFSATNNSSGTNLTISGHVTDKTGAMLEGVTVALGGAKTATTTTDADGAYAFTGLSNGTYTVSATSPNYTFAPVNPTYNLNGTSITTADFVGTAVQANSRNYSLFITMGTTTVNGGGGATIPVWTFSDNASTVKLPGPTLVANEGETVTVTVSNTHSTRNHNFIIKGITTDASPIAPGALRTYTFTASKAGVYIYYDSLNNNIDRSMGMYGVLVVNAAGGASTAWTNGPAYTFQRIWVAADLDKPRWNDVAGAGGTVDTNTYRANYFLLNGKGGMDAANDRVNTAIEGRVGQSALVRIANVGQYMQTFHFHANHVKVLTIDGIRQTAPFKLLDVIAVPPLTTMEVLFELNQPGEYPMHNHTAQMETANGTYGNGVMTKIYITP